MTTALRATGTVLGMHPGTLTRLVAILALVAGCTSAPSTPPSTLPSAPAPTGAAGATSGPPPSGPQPTGGPALAEPTSMSRIADALAAGQIDEPTAILYRLYAMVGDDRLPDAYAGLASEDGAVASLARERWDTLSVDQQAAILPFLVRPTSPRSWYAPATTASSGAGAVKLASWNLTASSCSNGFIQVRVSPTIPVLVWGQCGGGRSEAVVMSDVNEIVQAIAVLWTPMTAYMGDPIGDQNVAGDPFADSPEGGDGLLDIYVVDQSLAMHGRQLSTKGLAGTFEWGPLVGPSGREASSGYIVVRSPVEAGSELKSTIAHEFFHCLQNSHNDRGANTTPGWFWFVEASAVWAEHEFVPEARASKAYARFSEFGSSPLSLAKANGRNEYDSWVWPLFMEQELGRDAVAQAWRAFEGKRGYDELTSALDGMLSFKARFRDFAVRVWDERLDPGDPITPRFQAVDKDFPIRQPMDPRANGSALSVAHPLDFRTTLPSLWSQYWDIEPDSNVGSVAFDFSYLEPQDAVDVDLLLNINGNWERRSGNLGSEEKICDVRSAIVIIANHDSHPATQVGGVWSAIGDANKCNAKGSYSVVLTGGKTGAGTYSGTGYVGCAATTIDGRIYWSAIAVFPTAPFGSLTDFSLQQNPSGFDSITATAGGMETGLWTARSDLAQQTAHVGGSGAPGTNAHVSGDGSFKDSTGTVFTIHIAADCSDTSY